MRNWQSSPYIWVEIRSEETQKPKKWKCEYCGRKNKRDDDGVRVAVRQKAAVE